MATTTEAMAATVLVGRLAFEDGVTCLGPGGGVGGGSVSITVGRVVDSGRVDAVGALVGEPSAGARVGERVVGTFESTHSEIGPEDPSRQVQRTFSPFRSINDTASPSLAH